jgi:acyl-CoA synthetase (AMP-forming)/AMP-acid ligase II
MMAGAVYGKNSVEWLLANQVCTELGLRFSPINWHLVADEIAYIVDDCDADVVFFGAEFAKEVDAMKARTPKVKLWVCMDGHVDGAVNLYDIMNEAPADAKTPAHSRKGGAIGYTGGTSGRPKGALRSGPLTSDPKMMMAMLTEWGQLKQMPTPVQLIAAPLYHAMPNAWYGIGCPLGATFVLMAKFEAGAALDAIQRLKVTGFYMPPILLKRFMQVPPAVKAKYDCSSIKTIMSSGAACPSIVKQGINDMFGPVLYELYGASELGGVAVMEPEFMLKKPLSCGRPATGMDVIILDEQKNKIEKPNIPGEIYAKGMVIDGYHKQEAKTQEAKLGDYMSVGDVGYFDEDGFLYISDRKIDMVVSGGANIYPAQVEEIMQSHPDLEDVAIFGVPDEEYGERVHAAVKPFAGKTVTADAILKFCDGKIGKFQLPKAKDFTFHAEDFPRSEAGKLRKKQLKAQILSAPSSKL